MNYYLLSEQDIDELIWDVENFLAEIKEKLENKKLEPNNNGES